jgi:hypothetical protein
MEHAEIDAEHDEHESIEANPEPDVVGHGATMRDR